MMQQSSICRIRRAVFWMRRKYQRNFIMNNRESLLKTVMAALFAALTFAATMAVKIPTPAMGYVHAGDCIVLMSGILLGPLYGGFAAGSGSMLSDLAGGYALWAPGTFVIKFLTAYVAALLYKRLDDKDTLRRPARTAISGLAGETVMVAGYLAYDIVVLFVINAGTEEAGLVAALAQSLSEIPFNAVQGLTGVVLATILVPVISRIQQKAA